MGYHSIMSTITNTTSGHPAPALVITHACRLAPHGQPDKARQYPTEPDRTRQFFRESESISAPYPRVKPDNTRQYPTVLANLREDEQSSDDLLLQAAHLCSWSEQFPCPGSKLLLEPQSFTFPSAQRPDGPRRSATDLWHVYCCYNTCYVKHRPLNIVPLGIALLLMQASQARAQEQEAMDSTRPVCHYALELVRDI
jgi:hypothetical protein